MTICQIPDFLTPGRTKVMGIINVTPDSFSDGGAWFNPEKAIAHALELEAAGADILDIGGESTRPGAESLSPAQEQRRGIPQSGPYFFRYGQRGNCCRWSSCRSADH